jgi:hypothetical protein
MLDFPKITDFIFVNYTPSVVSCVDFALLMAQWLRKSLALFAMPYSPCPPGGYFRNTALAGASNVSNCSAICDGPCDLRGAICDAGVGDTSEGSHPERC